MPNMSYDPQSGALLFTPTKDELQQVEDRKRLIELEKKVAELTALLASVLPKEE